MKQNHDPDFVLVPRADFDCIVLRYAGIGEALSHVRAINPHLMAEFKAKRAAEKECRAKELAAERAELVRRRTLVKDLLRRGQPICYRYRDRETVYDADRRILSDGPAWYEVKVLGRSPTNKEALRCLFHRVLEGPCGYNDTAFSLHREDVDVDDLLLEKPDGLHFHENGRRWLPTQEQLRINYFTAIRLSDKVKAMQALSEEERARKRAASCSS